MLVLDDAFGSEQVQPLLPGTGGSLVLVTSRRHLSALDDATAISLDTLPPDDAATLLVCLAGRAGLSPAEFGMRTATVIIDENFPGKPGAGPAFGHMTAQLLHEVARNDKHLADLDQLSSPFQPIWGRRPLPQHRCDRGPGDAPAVGQ
jgi:hypothetical protein